jgi:hypothetical protein
LPPHDVFQQSAKNNFSTGVDMKKESDIIKVKDDQKIALVYR